VFLLISAPSLLGAPIPISASIPITDPVLFKGHSQLMHMRIRYHFLADLHVTRHACETESEKRIRNAQNKPCRVELVTSPNRDYIRAHIFYIPVTIHRWICPGTNIDEYF